MNEDKMQQQPQQQAPAQNGGGSNVEQIVAELKKKGLQLEQIIEELKKLVEAGQLTDEDFEKALAMLENEEKQEASKMFGMNLL